MFRVGTTSLGQTVMSVLFPVWGQMCTVQALALSGSAAGTFLLARNIGAMPSSYIQGPRSVTLFPADKLRLAIVK